MFRSASNPKLFLTRKAIMKLEVSANGAPRGILWQILSGWNIFAEAVEREISIIPESCFIKWQLDLVSVDDVWSAHALVQLATDARKEYNYTHGETTSTVEIALIEVPSIRFSTNGTVKWLSTPGIYEKRSIRGMASMAQRLADTLSQYSGDNPYIVNRFPTSGRK